MEVDEVENQIDIEEKETEKLNLELEKEAEKLMRFMKD